jgi:histidine triad (HIT) family protein
MGGQDAFAQAWNPVPITHRRNESMSDCIFCKIAAGSIPAQIVYQDEFAFAFRDINPSAPSHVLVIPKKHIPSLAATNADDTEIWGRFLLACARVAEIEGATDSGYRVVINTNRDAGQEVFHAHAHVMGGRAFGWPPG